jgi:hypothetical protein
MRVPITAVMMSTVSAERTRLRLIAVTKLRSVRSAKRLASCFSCVNACTVGIALRISPARAEASAIRSCDSRDSFLTRRPMAMMGRVSKAIRPRFSENR